MAGDEGNSDKGIIKAIEEFFSFLKIHNELYVAIGGILVLAIGAGLAGPNLDSRISIGVSIFGLVLMTWGFSAFGLSRNKKETNQAVLVSSNHLAEKKDSAVALYDTFLELHKSKDEVQAFDVYIQLRQIGLLTDDELESLLEKF